MGDTSKPSSNLSSISSGVPKSSKIGVGDFSRLRANGDVPEYVIALSLTSGEDLLMRKGREENGNTCI